MTRIDNFRLLAVMIPPIVAVYISGETIPISSTVSTITPDVFSVQIPQGNNNNDGYTQKCTGALVNSAAWPGSHKDPNGPTSNVALTSGKCGQEIQNLISSNTPPMAVFAYGTDTIKAVAIFQTKTDDEIHPYDPESASYALLELETSHYGGMLIPKKAGSGPEQLAYTVFEQIIENPTTAAAGNSGWNDDHYSEFETGTSSNTGDGKIKLAMNQLRIAVTKSNFDEPIISPTLSREYPQHLPPTLEMGTPLYHQKQDGNTYLFANIDDGRRLVTFKAFSQAIDNATPKFWRKVRRQQHRNGGK